MKPSTVLLLSCFLSACGVARPVLDQDNTKVEVKTVVERVVDTAYVQLPVYVDRAETLDTISVLENRLAVSSAVVSGGVLRHSLSTKAVPLPVPVEKEIVYRDSLVYRDRVVTQTVEVEKKLTLWQDLKQNIGGVALLFMLIYGVYHIISFIINLKSSKL